MDTKTLEKLQRIYDKADSFGKSLMEKEFPELIESEDERIKNAILGFLKGSNQEIIIPGISIKDAISWLEKQGKVKHTCRNCQTFQDLHQNCPYSPIYQCTDLTEAYKRLDDETHCEFWIEKQAKKNSKELPKGEDYGIDSLYHALQILQATLGEVEGYQSDDGILEHECAISAVEKLYTQIVWSKEDEEMFNETLYFINEYQKSDKCKDENGMQNSVSCEKWLHAIRNRLTYEQKE